MQNIERKYIVLILLGALLGFMASWYFLNLSITDLNNELSLLNESSQADYESLSSVIIRQYQNLTSTINEIKNELNNLSNTIISNNDTTSSELKILRNHINNLENQLLNSTNKINELNNYVENNEEDISDLLNYISIIDASLTNTNEIIDNIINNTLNRRYHLAFNINGTENTNTENITFHGEKIRLVWDIELEQTNSWLDMQLYYANGTFFSRITVSGVYSTFSSEIYLTEPGEYYMIIESYLPSNYDISIWDYY